MPGILLVIPLIAPLPKLVTRDVTVLKGAVAAFTAILPYSRACPATFARVLVLPARLPAKVLRDVILPPTPRRLPSPFTNIPPIPGSIKDIAI